LKWTAILKGDNILSSQFLFLKTCNGQNETRSYYARNKMKITLPKIFLALLHTTAVVGAANNYHEKAATRTSLRQVNNEAPAVKYSNLGSQDH
jgi:hypothetical protein